MQIHATIEQKVSIDPIEVIKKLIETELGYWKNWYFEEDGKYYIGSEESAGCHSYDTKTEISKEKFHHLQTLDSVRNYLEKNETK